METPVKSVRNGQNLYIPLKSDPIDVKVAEYLHHNPDFYNASQKIMLVREAPGIYDFGSRKVYIKIQNDKLLVKVGGGNISID